MTLMTAARRLLTPALAAILLLAPPVSAQTVSAQTRAGALSARQASPPALQPAPAAPADASARPRPWLYAKSDVPMDPAWHFGVLPNGVRYAVRHNDVPAGQISIRVRVDVGSLMETPSEAGFAHFMEHLTFRGSREVPDGESKRIWQRLGASFGVDSNAQTTPTGTTYALDLPGATEAGLAESFKILAGMLAEPNIVPEAVNAERNVVLAERRQGLGPARRLGDATREFYFAGQPLADHGPIGTVAALDGATPAALRAFHARWYRPQRTVIAVSGDADPAAIEAMIAKYFGTWHVAGPLTPLPDFGKPDPTAPKVKVIVEPNAPYTVSLAYLRPWVFHDDTIAFNEARQADQLALQLINRRLDQAASGDAAFLSAQVALDNSSRSVNATYVTIVPIGKDWDKALRQVRAIIEDAKLRPPSQADIDREFQNMEASTERYVASSAIESSADQAQMLVDAVDIRETVVTPQAQLAIIRSARSYMTPTKLLASTRRLFTGTAERALLSIKASQPKALERLSRAFETPVKPARDARVNTTPVTMADLPKLPPPGKVVANKPLGVLGIQEVTFANGVKLLLLSNKAEPGKVYVHVRFGHGQQSFSPDQDLALWAAPYALMASGVGKLDQSDMIALTNGRQLSWGFSVGPDAFEFDALTDPQDYRDQLRLFASKLAFPRWSAAPLKRTIAALKASYDPVPASAGDAFSRDLDWLLAAKDGRIAPQRPSDARELTRRKFRKLWAPLLDAGPIEIELAGDVPPEQAIAAVAATFGALPARKDVPPPAANRVLHFPAATAQPIILRHDGPKQQAAVAIAWPTGGGMGELRESRHLEILARIISDRLFEKLRSIDGAAYTPSASSLWPESYDDGGYLVVQTQIKPDRIPYFFQLMHQITADLAAHPVSQDELDRQIEPIRQLLRRASSSNAFWMNQLAGATTYPARLAATRSLATDLLQVTPQDIQALARRFLVPGTSWSAMALAKGVPVPAIAAAPPASPAARAPVVAPKAPDKPTAKRTAPVGPPDEIN